MKKNEQGVGAVLIVLGLLVIALTGAVGWLIYNKQKSNPDEAVDFNKNVGAPMTAEKSDEKNTTQSKLQSISNKYFSIQLPENWAETSEFIKIVADDKFIYENKTEEKKIVVFVNPGGFSVYNDSISYQVTDNKINLDINSLNKCSIEPPCSNIKDKLDLTVSAKNNETIINGKKYIFFYTDNKSDSTDSLNSLKTILSSMQFK